MCERYIPAFSYKWVNSEDPEKETEPACRVETAVQLIFRFPKSGASRYQVPLYCRLRQGFPGIGQACAAEHEHPDEF